MYLTRAIGFLTSESLQLMQAINIFGLAGKEGFCNGKWLSSVHDILGASVL